MKLPADAVISVEKLEGYLLTELPRGDKSRFLAEAGYTKVNADVLERDLRGQILTCDATLLPARGYGERYEIQGILRETVWSCGFVRSGCGNSPRVS